jgi:hypothetical protein
LKGYGWMKGNVSFEKLVLPMQIGLSYETSSAIIFII